MAKKRKAESQGMDEVERTIFTSFCVAANAISQMYTQTQQQHKIAFQAGERQALEKLYMWLQKEQQQGSNTTVAQVLDHVRSQLEGVSGRDEVAMPPGPHAQPWGFSVPPQLAHHGASGNHQAGGGVGGVSGIPRAPVPGMQRRGAVGGALESLHEPNSQYGRHQDFPTSYNPYSQGGGLPYGHNPRTIRKGLVETMPVWICERTVRDVPSYGPAHKELAHMAVADGGQGSSRLPVSYACPRTI